MKVIDRLWFSSMGGTAGIVCIEDDVTGDRKAYIGVAPGSNEAFDTRAIINYGNPIGLETVERLRVMLTKPEDDNEVCICGHKRKDHQAKMLLFCRRCECSKFKKK